jgi:hypothetical protein
MDWFTKFWKTTSEVFPARIPPQAMERLMALDPNRIYLENVRSILGVSVGRAQRICDTAVRRGFFSHRVLVLAPSGAVVKSAATREELPPTVRYWRDVEGDKEEEVANTADLQTLDVYALND